MRHRYGIELKYFIKSQCTVTGVLIDIKTKGGNTNKWLKNWIEHQLLLGQTIPQPLMIEITLALLED